MKMLRKSPNCITPISTFEWVNDFAKARNFNFGQVTKDYDYILFGATQMTYSRLRKTATDLEE